MAGLYEPLAAEVLVSKSTKQRRTPGGRSRRDPGENRSSRGVRPRTVETKTMVGVDAPVLAAQGPAVFYGVSLQVSVLPYREGLLDFLKSQRAQERSIVLATAADIRIARQVADFLGLFESIFATDGTTNLSGETKRNRLIKEFGEKGFNYAVIILDS